jgi:hypothetical protein
MAEVNFVDMELALARILEEFGDAVLDTSEGQAVQRVLGDFEREAVELAPVDTGNLGGATNTSVTKRGDAIVGTLVFATPYAAYVHELPESSRGEKTLRKPGNALGPAGPKYVERPLVRLRRDFASRVAAELERAGVI